MKNRKKKSQSFEMKSSNVSKIAAKYNLPMKENKFEKEHFFHPKYFVFFFLVSNQFVEFVCRLLSRIELCLLNNKSIF